MIRSLLTVSTVVLFVIAVEQSAYAAEVERYAVDYHIDLQPQTGTAAIRLHIAQDAEQSSDGGSKAKGALRRLSFAAPESRFTDVKADAGALTRDDDRLLWEVPAAGGELSYKVTIDQRSGTHYRARITDRWTVLRLDRLIPPMRSTTRTGAQSKASLSVTAPANWSIESRYGRHSKGATLPIDNPHRRFDRPTGWLIAGRLGVRRDTIQGRAIAIAAPVGTHYPRIPTLAFLRWTLPHFLKVFPLLPPQLLLVSGDERMWRGALSGPDSIYLHTERPLISENATSTLLHELVHVATRWRAAKGADWIVEGIAEYYSVELLHRSGGISTERYAAAFERLQRWADNAEATLQDPSTGANTARAVILFKDLDTELRRVRPDLQGLDSLVASLVEQAAGAPVRIGLDDLNQAIEKLLGGPSRVLRALDAS